LVAALIMPDEEPEIHFVTNIVNSQPEHLRVDMPVEVEFQEINDEITLPFFRPIT
jgi:hypothetical protein